jgi:anti-sigma regulatory factor (Ser/Thr protein kinase)
VQRWTRTLAASVDEVEAFCLSFRRDLAGQWRRSDVFAAELVLREVLANAVEHGGHFDRSQTIAVDLTVSDGRLRGRISDHGSGFVIPPQPVHQSERGRGLEILNRYAVVHAFEDGGRTVAFELPLHPPALDSKE